MRESANRAFYLFLSHAAMVHIPIEPDLCCLLSGGRLLQKLRLLPFIMKVAQQLLLIGSFCIISTNIILYVTALSKVSSNIIGQFFHVFVSVCDKQISFCLLRTLTNEKNSK